jgi:hypothetical protein
MINWRTMYRVIAASVAQWDPDAETWNTPVEVPNLQGISLTPMTDTDEKRVYGAHEKFLSVITGLECTLNFVGRDDAAFVEMTGYGSTESGSGSGETRRTRYAGGTNLAYFGLILALEADDGGDVHIMLPYGKLSSIAGLEMSDENQFVVPNITARFGRLRLADGTLHDVMTELEHAVVTDVPSDFNTAFAGLVIS